MSSDKIFSELLGYWNCDWKNSLTMASENNNVYKYNSDGQIQLTSTSLVIGMTIGAVIGLGVPFYTVGRLACRNVYRNGNTLRQKLPRQKLPTAHISNHMVSGPNISVPFTDFTQ